MAGAMIGAGLGMLYGTPWAIVCLGLVLAFIGYQLDEINTAPEVDPVDFNGPRRPPAPDELADRAREALERHVAALFVAMTSLQGDPLPRQVRLFRHFFAHDLGYAEPQLERVRRALKEALAAPQPVESAAGHCVEALGETERLLLFDSLVDVALVDGAISAAERALLERLAVLLALDMRDVANVFTLSEGSPLEKAYKLLGVAAETPEADVKRAWRRLAALHHPDKVAHLGAAAVAAAETRFREIQAAWEEIQRARKG